MDPQARTVADLLADLEELRRPIPRASLARRVVDLIRGKPAAPIDYVNHQLASILQGFIQHGARLEMLEGRLTAVEDALADHVQASHPA